MSKTPHIQYLCGLLAVAVAAITRHSGQSYRKLKTIKRIA